MCIGLIKHLSRNEHLEHSEQSFGGGGFSNFIFAPGLFDVGYFLIGALSPSERRKHDRRLVKLYYDGLKKLGNHLEDETTLPFELFYQRYLVGAFF